MILHLLLAVAISDIAWEVRLDQSNTIHAAHPFEAAALSWSASSDVTVRVRTSMDQRTWSQWIALALDEDLTDRSAGRYLTSITHFSATKQYLEVSFSGPVARATVTMFPSPPPREGRIRSESLAIGSITGLSRVDWACPDGEVSPLWTPQYTNVTHAVVHHTAGANDLPDWPTEVRNIWYFHTFSNGWGDIGYNYLIDPNGVVYEGRAGGSGAIGAHFSCRNTNTVGVALLGTYSNVAPTAAALASLESLLWELCRRNGIDPMAFAYHAPTALNLPTIIGHRDGNASSVTCSKTECPGDVLYALLPSIRSDVAAIKPPPAPPRRRAVRPQ